MDETLPPVHKGSAVHLVTESDAHVLTIAANESTLIIYDDNGRSTQGSEYDATYQTQGSWHYLQDCAS